AVDDMRPCELRLVLVEAVRKKYREIVHPHIARCSREQDPVVLFGNLEEGLHPCSIPDETLFVKYEERILDFCVLGDVVPGVHLECSVNVLLAHDAELLEVSDPVQLVTLLL